MEPVESSSSDRFGVFKRLSKEFYQSSFRIKPIDQLNAETSRCHPESARVLTLADLVVVGVSGTLGAGLFFLLGRAARTAVGPGVSISFLLAAGVCALVGLSYAEMSSRIPSCGGAYSFAYATLGELAAFLVGWCLSLEYGVASAAIARSWAAYVRHGFSQTASIEVGEHNISLLAPLLILVLTLLLASGLREGRYIVGFSTLVFGGVLLAVFFFGLHLIRPRNWAPFLPYGWRSVLTGSASLFFAYVGFDEVATVAEESHAPTRNVPFAMLASLGIVASVCIIASIIVTGIQPYSQLSDTAPFAGAFEYAGSTFFAKIVAIGTVIGLQNTAMIALLAQPRLFMAMSRDGLLPEIFGELSGSGNTPRAATILCGVGLAIIALLFPLHSLSDMISAGTLVAYAAVCLALIRTRLIVSGHGRDSGGLLTLLSVSFVLCALIWRVGNESAASMLGGGFIAGVPLLLLARVPLASESDPPRFLCPLMPWTPALGAFFSIVLLFQLSRTGLLLLLFWTLIGLCIYIFYGFRHSHARNSQATDFGASVRSGRRLTNAPDAFVEAATRRSMRVLSKKQDPATAAGSDRTEEVQLFQRDIDLLADAIIDLEDEEDSLDHEDANEDDMEPDFVQIEPARDKNETKQ
jgi:APA family basic amino acid/polyamine antiporter